MYPGFDITLSMVQKNAQIPDSISALTCPFDALSFTSLKAHSPTDSNDMSWLHTRPYAELHTL